MERYQQEQTDPRVNATEQSSQPIDSLIGQPFAEKYKILHLLGQGGMSKVYLARHEAMAKKVAIKILPTHLATQNQSLLRFKNEAQVASALSHPGIVTMHDYGVTTDGMPYLVMDFVEGEPLAELVETGQQLPLERVLDIFIQACKALYHAHKKGIVHRDIKPSNIMLTKNDQNQDLVKIVDFGIAKMVIDTSEAPKLTQTGESIGSPLYMSPEQCLNHALDTRSDIYSLGCVMYELLTGRPALSGDSVFSIMAKQVNEMPHRFKDVRPDWTHDPVIERIVFKALAKDPSKRYQSAEELLSALEARQKGAVGGWLQQVSDNMALWTMGKSGKRNVKLLATQTVMGMVVVGAIVYAARTLPAVAEPPSRAELSMEPQPWTIYKDDAKTTDETTKDARSIVYRMADIINDFQIYQHPGSKEQILQAYTMATNQRHDGRYFDAVENYTKVTNLLGKQIYGRKTFLNQNEVLSIYLQASFQTARCQYYSSNFKAAQKSFEAFNRACDHVKTVAGFFPATEAMHMEADLKSADCHYFQGDSEAAARMNKKWFTDITNRKRSNSSHERVYALYFSKFGECELRIGNYANAAKVYELAANEWKELSDDRECELNNLLAVGKIGEALVLDGRNQAAAPFLQQVNDQLENYSLDSKQSFEFSNILQCYAHILWQQGHYLDAVTAHRKSAALRPQTHMDS